MGRMLEVSRSRQWKGRLPRISVLALVEMNCSKRLAPVTPCGSPLQTSVRKISTEVPLQANSRSVEVVVGRTTRLNTRMAMWHGENPKDLPVQSRRITDLAISRE